MDTQRTQLTLLQETDLSDVIAMAKEPDTFKYLKFLRMMSEEEYERFLRGKLEQIRTKIGYHWAVRSKENGAFIGAVNLNLVKGTTMMQIGCQLKRDYWHQGLAFELMQRLVTFAAEDLQLKEVYGVFAKDNFISRRLLAKLGFVWQETKQESPEADIVEIHKYIIPTPITAPPF